MKPILKQLLTFALLALVMSVSAYAQPGAGHDGWRERVRSQKIAFITSEVGLTPQEAEKFWPVYNDMEKARKVAFRKVMMAYDALKKGISENRPESELSVLLNRYVEAMKTSRDVEARFTPQLTRIVSVEKVGKLFIGEEEFRRMQIGRWNEKKD